MDHVTSDAPPWVRHTSPAWFAHEVEAVFACEWLPVARVSELPDLGSYRVVDCFGESIVLVRDSEGTIRALSNVCRHRQAMVKTGAGTVSRLICPYHHWTYALDGTLISAPCMDRTRDFDQSRLGLSRFAVDEWQGWVFVALSERIPPPLAQGLEPVSARLDALSFREWVVAWRLSYPAPWNWKLMIENFAESYHHLAVHRRTLNPFWPAAKTAGVATNGAYAELRHPDHPEAGTFTVWIVFPALAFAVQSPRPVAYWLDLTVRGPADMTVDLVLLAPPAYAADTVAMEAHAMAIDTINREDFAILASAQRAIGSRRAEVGPLSHLEQPVALFRAYLDRMMAGVARGPE